MNLFIIEAPNKEESVGKYLGKDYKVFATIGHIRDLPAKTLAVQINKNFEPIYEIMPDKVKVVNQLKNLAKKADKIYIATDPDREGEAIAYHIAYILGIDASDKVRVAFNSIDKDTISKALENPRVIDENLVNAQQARRVLDRLVGYKISPILCKKIKPNLSAGRVQSAALKLIVDREKEILNFTPTEYWTLSARLKKGEILPEIKASLVLKTNEKIKNQDEMNEILDDVQNEDFFVSNVKKSITKSKPQPPFTTSSLQQDAGNKLNFSVKKTTSLAQTLYAGTDVKGEGKVALVTYIRSDSTRVSEGAQIKAKEFIVSKFGEEYCPKKFNVYKSKQEAQDAHEAIRPIDINRTPESLKDKIEPDLYKLYKLIYNRFLASQMTDAEYNSVAVDIKCGKYNFKVSGKTPKFLGFTSVYVDKEKENEVKLPPLEVGDKLNLLEFLPEQKWTKPEPRYTEATIVKAMEEKGIGRPATYAATINVLLTRYCTKDGKSIVPSETAFKVMDFLEKNFSKTININFTAQMESALDEIADGKREWHQLIDGFYKKFVPQLKNAGATSIQEAEIKVTDVICEKCGANMVEKDGRYGKFLACPNYPNCKNVKSLKPKNEEEVTDSNLICELCGAKLVLKKGKYGNFYGCSNYPNCTYIKKIERKKSQSKDSGNQTSTSLTNTSQETSKMTQSESNQNTTIKEDVICDKCGAKMVLKNGKYGEFLACPNFPKCKNIVNIKNLNKTKETNIANKSDEK